MGNILSFLNTGSAIAANLFSAINSIVYSVLPFLPH